MAATSVQGTVAVTADENAYQSLLSFGKKNREMGISLLHDKTKRMACAPSDEMDQSESTQLNQSLLLALRNIRSLADLG